MAALLPSVGRLLPIPGLIAVLVGFALPPQAATDGTLAALWPVTFAAGGSGIYLITWTRRLAGDPPRRRNPA